MEIVSVLYSERENVPKVGIQRQHVFQSSKPQMKILLPANSDFDLILLAEFVGLKRSFQISETSYIMFGF